jgi:hypothetical protein
MAPAGEFFTHRPADSAFVFVDNHHVGSRLTSASVVVNNPALIRRTTFVANTEHTARDFDGVGPRKVIMNEGPGLVVMEKNTGRTFTKVSVIELITAHPCPPVFDMQPFQPEFTMNNKHWHRRTMTRRAQTKRKTEMSLLPENIGRLTVSFQSDPPLLLKVQIRIREAVMDTGTNMTEVQRPAEFPYTG